MIVSGVGSLPHVDPVAAVDLVAATCDVPYLPELPNRHPEEGMLRRWGDGLCGLGVSDEALGLAVGAPVGPREEAFVGAEVALERLPPSARLKTQVTGPLTLALAALAGGADPRNLLERVVAGLVERLADHLERIARARPGTETIVVLDEPALVAFAPDTRPAPIPAADVVDAWGELRRRAGRPLDVHCCGDTDWSMVAGFRPGRIWWDLEVLDAPGFLGSAVAVAEAVAAGTRLVWGLVPVRPGPVDEARIVRRHGATVARLVVEGAPLAALGDAWATPACGLAGVTVAEAERIIADVRRLADALA